MQVIVAQSPAPSAPPALPPSPASLPAGVVTQRMLSGAPLTVQEVSALLARRKELSNQVSSATQRRQEVARQLRRATGADKAGLEQRLAVLDARIARLEADIDETGKQLSVPPVAVIAARQQPMLGWGPYTDNGLRNSAAPLMGLFILFVLFPIAVSTARALWKRGSLQRSSATPPDTTRRLERLEQAIDAVAIEVERISEGQRFVTRLLSEGRAGVTRQESEAKVEVLGSARGGRAPV